MYLREIINLFWVSWVFGHVKNFNVAEFADIICAISVWLFMMALLIKLYLFM